VFEPFHGFSLPTGKHMRVAERSLQIRMPQNRLRHTQRLMLVQQSRARVTQVMPTHLRKPDPFASGMDHSLENVLGAQWSFPVLLQ